MGPRPDGVDGTIRVWVGGAPPVDGEDYFIVGRLIIFARLLTVDGRRSSWRLVLPARWAGARRRHDAVDVWFESDTSAGVVRDPHLECYPSPTP